MIQDLPPDKSRAIIREIDKLVGKATVDAEGATTRAEADRLKNAVGGDGTVVAMNAERRRPPGPAGPVDSAAFDVSRRVAVQLVRLAEEHGRRVPEGVVIEAALSQEDIAGQVGAARRTVARALRVLRERGIIETGRRRILIREPRVLRAFAHD